MKALQEIAAFPQPLRDVLETTFGINSAEAFFDHATRNAAGMGKALRITPAELEQHLRLVASYLPAEFIERCHKPVKTHARGVIVKPKPA